MKVGTIIYIHKDNIAEKFRWYAQQGFTNCQLSMPLEDLDEAHAQQVRQAVQETGIEITAMIGVWSGPQVWDFYSGPQTLGIMPIEYRYQRMQDLICCAKFAKSIGCQNIATHLGFIPENPQDPIFVSFLCALRYLVEEYRKLGINLLFETGQETPATLLRVFGELNAENVGLNFDPANLLMYGKANPVDALDIVGRYVKGVHGKDGEYPTNGKELGREMPMGQGRVDFPRFVAKLKEVGYNGAITIEREIAGDQQLQDVLAAKAMLEGIIEKLG